MTVGSKCTSVLTLIETSVSTESFTTSDYYLPYIKSYIFSSLWRGGFVAVVKVESANSLALLRPLVGWLVATKDPPL